MKNKTQKIILAVLIVILAAIFLFSAWQLGKYLVESITTKGAYNDLADMRGENTPSRPVPTVPPTSGTEPTQESSLPSTEPPETTVPPATQIELVTVIDPETGAEVSVLPEFAELYVMNNDMVGWIEIPGTVVSYPVMQTPDNVDYYLHRDFYKKYNLHGCIYAREQCDINKPSDNITLYGHRMNDGSMFNSLIDYTKESFYREHRYIYFDTLTERHTYEVMAVFTTTATVGKGFAYHQFVDAADEKAFNDFVNTCKSNSFVDTGVTAQLGDKLITLSTCEYSHENGRLVVVAKRVA